MENKYSSEPVSVDLKFKYGSPKDLVRNKMEQFNTNKTGPLAGGSFLPEREDEFVSYSVNFISENVLQAASIYAPGTSKDIRRFQELLRSFLAD